MLTHSELGFNVSHSYSQVTLLRLLLGGRLKDSLRLLLDDRNLAARDGVFKVKNTRVKP
jgi:hypothetical protein